MNRRKIAAAVAAALTVTTLACSLLAGNEGGSEEASGTVEATEARLGFQVAGRIASILVREGDDVSAGDTLALLDRAELLARHAQARAQLDGARAVLAELLAGSRSEERAQAREGLRAVTEQMEDARRDLDRVRRLTQAGALSQEQLDRAQLAFEVAAARRTQAAEQSGLVESGPRPERIAAQRAAVAQAEGALGQVEALLASSVITAPWPGTVTVRDREAGETVPAGAPVVTLTNLADRWVRIYVREDAIGSVTLGQGAIITADVPGGSGWSGAVSFISARAEFTPRNVQTREERVKLVFAVKVSVTGDSANVLKPGMPADVRLLSN